MVNIVSCITSSTVSHENVTIHYTIYTILYSNKLIVLMYVIERDSIDVCVCVPLCVDYRTYIEMCYQ